MKQPIHQINGVGGKGDSFAFWLENAHILSRQKGLLTTFDHSSLLQVAVTMYEPGILWNG
jgi:hypothetical protein